MAEKSGKLRELTVSDLNKKERDLSSSLFNLRMRVATKQTGSFAQIKLLKSDIARIKTIKAEIEARAKEENNG